MSICKNCGKEIPDDAVFCSYCGEQVMGNDVNSGLENSSSYQNSNYNSYQNDNYQNNNYNDYNKDYNDSGNGGWGLLGCCIPIVGLILWLVWKNEKPKTARVAGIGALVGVIIGVLFYVLMFGIGIVGLSLTDELMDLILYI